MRKNNERGAIVVEATISLFAFVFVIFTILSIVDICYIQAKMSVALNSAAKEISQYSYLYYKFGVDGFESEISDATEDSRDVAVSTITGVGELMDSLSETKTNIENNEFDKIVPAIEEGADNVDSLITMYADQLSDDPKGFIIGMGKMALNELGQDAKALLGQLLAKSLMQKNLKAYKADDPENFLRRHRVVDGMAGLDFNYTSLMAYGKDREIQLVVTYDVQVIKLLNIDYKFTFRQVAKTEAWGRGSTLIEEKAWIPSEEQTVWDNPNDMQRGKDIVASEKEKYQYTSSGDGFHAYDPNTNEFIGITSVNTHNKTYQDSDKIKNILSKMYGNMYSNVEDLKESFNVKDKNGNSVTVTSNKETRNYRIVLVVPDNADMETVQKAVDDYIKDRKDLGEDVKVDIVTDYGHPTSEEKKENS